MRSGWRLGARVICAGIGFHALAASAQSPAESCWQRVSLPAETVLDLMPAGKQPATLTYRTAQGPVAVTGTDGKTPANNPSFTGRLVLAENAGTLAAADGEIRATTNQGGVFAVRAGDRTRFGATAGTEVFFRTGVAITGGRLTHPASGVVTLEAERPREVLVPAQSMLQPDVKAFEDDQNLPLKFESMDASPQPSVSPVNSLLVTVAGHGAQVYEDKDILSACFRIGGEYYRAPIIGVAESEENEAEIVLKLPEELARSTWETNGEVALVAADGSYFATDTFSMRGRWWGLAWGAGATLGTLLVLGLAATPTLKPTRDWSVYSWFTGPDGKASLSRFQILLWTVVVFFCLVYVFAITGKLFTITGQVLSLLGIAGTGSVLAGMATSAQPQTPASAPSRLDLFQTDGRFDLYKFQMFIFTVGAAAFVVFRVIADQAFPELDTNLLLLLGISNGIYVGSKFTAAETPLQEAARLDSEAKVLELAKERAEKEVARYAGEVALAEKNLAAAKHERDDPGTTADQKLKIETEVTAHENRLALAEQSRKGEVDNLARISAELSKAAAALQAALVKVR